jgi:hypothetical protein
MGRYIRQPPEVLAVGVDIDPDLLTGFALGGSETMSVTSIQAPTGKSHMPGPGITGAMGALDHQNLGVIAAIAHQQGHRGAATAASVGGAAGFETGQLLGNGSQGTHSDASIP